MASKKPIQGLFYGMRVSILSADSDFPIQGLCLGIYRESGSYPVIEYYRLKLDDGSNHFIAKDSVFYVNAMPPEPSIKVVK